ncbi:hypothetical protein NHQ30_004313 [Ciborinia camelliae]|nr:hypothetical protein NHQ30_004313 [Ciborinia camelliae]
MPLPAGPVLIMYCSLLLRPLSLTLALCFTLLLVVATRFNVWGEGRRGSQGNIPKKDRPGGNSFEIPDFSETYDYIASLVVGGGTARNTLAARLAEDIRGFSVTVIEAGSFYEFENGNLTEVRGCNGWSTHIDEMRPPLVGWDIETTHQVGHHWFSPDVVRRSRRRSMESGKLQVYLSQYETIGL